MSLTVLRLNAFSKKVYAYDGDGNAYVLRGRDDRALCEVAGRVTRGDFERLPRDRIPVTLARVIAASASAAG